MSPSQIRLGPIGDNIDALAGAAGSPGVTGSTVIYDLLRLAGCGASLERLFAWFETPGCVVVNGNNAWEGT